MPNIEIYVSGKTYDALRKYAHEYRTGIAGMLEIITAYYFGAGDHLRCEHCAYTYGGELESCAYEDTREMYEEAMVPLLDKGTVAVGHLANELGKCKTAHINRTMFDDYACSRCGEAVRTGDIQCIGCGSFFTHTNCAEYIAFWEGGEDDEGR